MYEAIAILCLALAGDTCRPQLLPGYEAPTLEGCETALKARPSTAPSAQCAPVGEALSVTETAPGVFVHLGQVEEPNTTNRGDTSNLGFVVGANSVAVIDSGTARWMGEALWRAIRVQTDKPVSHVILTHMHPDHVLGASVLAEAGATVVGHAALPRALADRRDGYLERLAGLIGPPSFIGTETAQVDIPVESTLTLDLGGRVLELRAWQVAHTGTDLTVLDRETGTLFAGDLLFDRHTPALDGSLNGWRAVLAEMEGQPFRQVVPGHGGPVLAWPEGAANLDRYLEVLETDTRAAIADGMRLGVAVEKIAEGERPNWELFDAYNARNATVAFTELEWD